VKEKFAATASSRSAPRRRSSPRASRSTFRAGEDRPRGQHQGGL